MIVENKWEVECQHNPDITFNQLIPQEYQPVIQMLSREGFTHPSPIQVETILNGLKGKNLIAQSKSGTGKTIAFLTLVFCKLKPSYGLQAIIISPTRELSNQIYNVACSLNEQVDLKKRLNILLMIGGLPINDDIQRAQGNPDLLIGTVGRIGSMFEKKILTLDRIRLVVIDEADILLKCKEFRRFFGAVRAEKAKRPLQLCCFSATFNPTNLAKYFRFLCPCVRINNNCLVKPDNLLTCPLPLQSLNVAELSQYCIPFESSPDRSDGLIKIGWVATILRELSFEQAIVFYNDKGRGDQIVAELKEQGIYQQAAYFHGDLIQAHRIKLMNRIRNQNVKIIICTDIVSG